MTEGEPRTSIDVREVLREARETTEAAKAEMEEIRGSLGLSARTEDRPALKLIKGGGDA
jgi:hypothetical protein